jgi:hypothetical protein
MSSIHYIRSNRKDISLNKDMSCAEVIKINTRINTCMAYEFRINTLEEWRIAVKQAKIVHYFCYDEQKNKIMCEPILPLSDSDLYKIEMAWKEVKFEG